MHPALSVIFFTSISGCGYGLLFLVGLALAASPQFLGRTDALLMLATGAVFALAGLMSSMLHLGKPPRAWRAFSQWRTSWLSREGVAAVITFVPLLALVLWSRGHFPAVRALAAALAAMSVVTVVCTARIYTSLKTIPAWHNRYVLPAYLAFALLGGGVWFAAVDSIATARDAFVRVDGAILIAMLGAWTALLKYGYWKFIDAAPPAATTESATGLGRFGTVRSVEAPHTEENYLTREMGFALARKHSTRLRAIAIVLFAVVPTLAAALALLERNSLTVIATLLAAISIAAGTFVERWLFFAEAKHVVMLYYGRGPGAED